MKEIIEGLKALNKPSRKLDVMIMEYFGWKFEDGIWVGPNGEWKKYALPFTNSVDSVLQYFPMNNEYWSWSLSFPARDNGVYIPEKYKAVIHSPISSGGGPKWTGYGCNPAVALLIACFETQQATEFLGKGKDYYTLYATQ